VNDRVNDLVRTLDAAFNRRSWHGTNLRGSIRGITARQAVWRPARARHNIWELVVHAAYWKYICVRRFTGGTRGSFPLAGSNWFERNDAADERGWKKDVALLDEQHRQLRAVVEALSPRQLDETPRGSKVSNFDLLSGIAAHDLYHAGQIQILKRLQKKTGRG
jgi:uncharacterized damage-inducible protein DinB